MGFSPGAVPRPSASSPGEIDFRLARQATLGDYRSGRIGRQDICDAHPELRRAGRECGTPTGHVCPVCADAELMHVRYVFGPRLPAHGRCITSERELARIAQRRGEFACYVVEVCPACAWNHLARAYLIGQF
jgi:Family of unknown function (DUF5318)